MQGTDERQSSSVWGKYVEAKQHVFGAVQDGDAEQTLEELDAAIAKTAAASGIPETGMPPRSIVHESRRPALSAWFYLTLVLLFAALVAGLLWWGSTAYR